MVCKIQVIRTILFTGSWCRGDKNLNSVKSSLASSGKSSCSDISSFLWRHDECRMVRSKHQFSSAKGSGSFLFGKKSVFFQNTLFCQSSFWKMLSQIGRCTKGWWLRLLLHTDILEGLSKFSKLKEWLFLNILNLTTSIYGNQTFHKRKCLPTPI